MRRVTGVRTGYQTRRSAGPLRSPRSPRRAFTVIELAVVIGIIVLLVALAVPAFNSMSAESRHTSAVQSINGILTRAHIAAIGERSMMAVRFGPAAWDLDETAEGAADKNRQIAVTYRYVCTVDDPNHPGSVVYAERFERREESQAVRLPTDVWIAPAESLDRTTDEGVGILTGRLGTGDPDQAFYVNWDEAGFLDADDFLVVFDPHTGLLTSRSADSVSLLTFNPRSDATRNYTTITRRYFSGVVIYPREPFATLGDDADAVERQTLLRRIGQAYYVNRHSGVLVAGEQEGP